MAIRPHEAYWFDLYVPREQTVYAVEALASTNLVQLEVDPKHHSTLNIELLRDTITQYKEIKKQYGAYLPDPDQFPTLFESTPDEDAAKSLSILSQLGNKFEQLLSRQQKSRNQLQELLLLDEYLRSLGDEQQDLAAIGRETGVLYKAIYSCPRSDDLTETHQPEASVSRPSHSDHHDFYLVVDTPSKGKAIDRYFSDQGCHKINIPDWLESGESGQESRLLEKIGATEVDINKIEEQLKQYKSHEHAGRAVSNLELLGWYIKHASETSFEKKLCYVSGWSSTEDIKSLQKALDKHHIRSVIRLCNPPIGTHPPVTSSHSWWTQPFQIFTSMMGTPGHAEVDPNVILPVIVPLLFGYMFPDVGHGLILTFIGLLLFKRWPASRFLIPCGLVATAFGFLFGEVFGLEDVLPTLWIHPLEDPILIMVVPFVFGILLMLLGLVFNGIEAWWRSEFRSWLLSDAAVLFLYASALVSAIYIDALWITLLTLIWYVMGSLIRARNYDEEDFFSSIGNLAQSVFELVLNTISFLRVGAFALAHAALSAGAVEIISLVDDTSIKLIMFVILHVFIIVIEGFVVFVQTTRLILFEFFIRFLRVDGRIFNPVARPHTSG